MFIVAWGIAPGTRVETERLAEGHVHLGRQSIVNMAYSQENTLLSRFPGALPQATMNVGFQPTPSASIAG